VVDAAVVLVVELVVVVGAIVVVVELVVVVVGGAVVVVVVGGPNGQMPSPGGFMASDRRGMQGRREVQSGRCPARALCLACSFTSLLFPCGAAANRGTISVDSLGSYHRPGNRQDEMRAILTEQRPSSYDERAGDCSGVDARCMHASARPLEPMIA
jgi:hypothetical protein